MRVRIAIPLLVVMLAGNGLGEWQVANAALLQYSVTVAAVNGNIVLFPTGGGPSTRLTSGGKDGRPVLAPDGTTVAFLRWPGGLHPHSAMPSRHMVMIATRDTDGQYTVRRFSSRMPLTSSGRATLAWRPGAGTPELAWFEARHIVVKPVGGAERQALLVDPALHSGNLSTIAWSPDGREIASPIELKPGSTPPTTLHLALANLQTGRRWAITIGFRPHVLSLGGPNARGSYPVGGGLAFWGNHRLVFGTISRGMGYLLTGVFIVADTGGVARLLLGNGNSVHGYPPYNPLLDGATQFKLSPNQKYSATDPLGRIAVSGEVSAPRTVRVVPAGSCVLAQWNWAADSMAVAYVTACTIGGTSPIRYRLTLGTVALSGGAPRILTTVLSASPDAIDLAPIYRCVACGG